MNKEGLVELKNIDKELFLELCKEYYEEEKGGVHFYYINDFTYGIYYNSIPVGFIICNKFINNLVEVRTLVKKEFRGKKIAPKAKELLIETTGEIFSDCPKYLSLIDYENISSIKSAKNSGWSYDYEITEKISEEGSECLEAYIKNNPYYKKTKRLVNEYDNK